MQKSFSYLISALFSVALLSSCALAQAQKPPLQTTLSVPILAPRTNDGAPAGAEIAEQVPKARAILNTWQNQNPQPGQRVIRLVYWNPADRESLPNYRERLTKILLDIQNFYAFEMNRNGFGPLTFKLEKDTDGLLKFYSARGSKPRSEYGKDSGNQVRQDAQAALKQEGIDGSKETVLVFCNLVNWDAQTRTMTGDFPYNGEGTTRRGTCVQVDCPVLSLDGLTDVSEADKVHNNQYGFLTLARYNSIFIGGMAHEFGHALSLDHNRERDDQLNWGHSIMDTGNRTYGEDLREPAKGDESNGKGAFLTLPDALRLASHPSFSGSIKGIEGKPNAVVSNVKISAEGKTLIYSAHVSADPPVYAVVAYFDPAGNADYNSRSTSAIPDKEGNFTIKFAPTEPGKTAELRIVPLQVNGASSKWAGDEDHVLRYPYALNADGSVDLSVWNTTQQMAPLVAAINANDRKAAEVALNALKAQNAPQNLLDVAQVQIAAFDNPTRPTPTEATGNTLLLSEAKPREATVGWLQPAYNRLPSGAITPLFESNGQFFARGIYAHGPAHHVYDLGGKWNHLTSTVGLAQGQGGSVGFTIMGDGKELWKSNIVREGDLLPFDVSVQGVQTLELLVDNGNDGANNDWGLWLNPTLTR